MQCPSCTGVLLMMSERQGVEGARRYRVGDPERAQALAVLAARGGLADAVHLHAQAREPPRLVEVHEQRDHLDVGAGGGDAAGWP